MVNVKTLVIKTYNRRAKKLEKKNDYTVA